MSYDSEHNPVLGIDLGTTNSAIAYWKGEGKGPVPYEVDKGEKTLQSVVCYDDNSSTERKRFLVGKWALKKGELNPSYMAREFKRKMNNASPCILLGGRKFSPVELSAEVLKNIYSDAISQRPGSQSRSTVVTVPYDFDETACENTKQAAKIADINFKKLLQEPIAASLSYALDKVDHTLQGRGEEKFLVFDLGGGTFDLTLFRLQQQPNKLTFEVLATGGHSKLGGIDFDRCLTDFLLEQSKVSLENIREVKQERLAKRKLKDAVIEIKHELSHIDSSYCPPIELLPNQPLDLMIGRQDFELSIEFYLNQIKSILSQLWQQAKIQPNEVNRVVLVGGSSRIPCIRQLLIENIGSDIIYEHPRPDLCVAEGAAIYSAYLEGLPVFGNREVEIVTDGFDANISILNEKLEELRQEVSNLQLQLKDKEEEIQKVEANLKDIQQSENKKIPLENSSKSSQNLLKVGQLVEGNIIKILKNKETEKEYALLVGKKGLQFTAFLHISEISGKFLSSISDYFEIDQPIKGVITNIKNNNRINISTKVLENYSGEILEKMAEVMSEAEARLPQARQKLSL